MFYFCVKLPLTQVKGGWCDSKTKRCPYVCLSVYPSVSCLRFSRIGKP